jgi:hypothetical protein
MSRTFRCLTAVLILALLAGTGAVQALPMTKAKGPDGPRFEAPFTAAWNWVVAVVEKAGSFIDPNGHWLLPEPDPTSPDSGTTVEAGSFIDPNGGS